MGGAANPRAGRRRRPLRPGTRGFWRRRRRRLEQAKALLGAPRGARLRGGSGGAERGGGGGGVPGVERGPRDGRAAPQRHVARLRVGRPQHPRHFRRADQGARRLRARVEAAARGAGPRRVVLAARARVGPFRQGGPVPRQGCGKPVPRGGVAPARGRAGPPRPREHGELRPDRARLPGQVHSFRGLRGGPPVGQAPGPRVQHAADRLFGRPPSERPPLARHRQTDPAPARVAEPRGGLARPRPRPPRHHAQRPRRGARRARRRVPRRRPLLGDGWLVRRLARRLTRRRLVRRLARARRAGFGAVAGRALQGRCGSAIRPRHGPVAALGQARRVFGERPPDRAGVPAGPRGEGAGRVGLLRIPALRPGGGRQGRQGPTPTADPWAPRPPVSRLSTRPASAPSQEEPIVRAL
mmetsp:Transcript_48169/g.109446  ORF Transcript_48169/g.109446 Transcript_48169/m.109446 type:complete len:411 (-) Transcript_48169:72-1304(-)